jgi:hypothetical protein
MDVSDLLQKYADGHRRFVLINLRGAKLAGTDLSGANFNRSNLTEANLVRAKLGDVSLVRANLTRADLRGANLVGVNLRNANLTGADIDLTDLPPETYAGAILPDGSRQPLVTESPAAAPLAAAAAADADYHPGIPLTPQTVSRALQEAEQWPTGGASGTTTLTAERPSPSGLWPGMADLESLDAAPMTASPQAGIWRRLPWLQLSFWSMGYGFLGLFLYLYAADMLAWPLVWLSSLLWLGDASWLWFVPVAAAVAVIWGSGISSGAMLVGGLVALGLAAGLQATGWAWRRALRGGLWIGGVGCILVAIAPLMLARSQTTGIGIPATLPLGLMVAIGVGLITLGTQSLPRLQALVPQPRDTAIILASGAGFGLVISCLIGWLAIAGAG